ncbi:hypothetical protein ACLB2K_077016 [Fragaria x ananassa]
MKGGKEKGKGKDGDGDVEKQKVPLYKLFQFADQYDIELMVVGSVSAIVNGLSQPFMTLIFGNLINTFGATDRAHIVPTISKVALKFVYLGIGTGIAAFLQVSCWMVTGERQDTRIRSMYLKAILRQDIGYFDTEINTGEIIGRMSGDTILIQDAMGEKVGKFIQLLSTFVGGFIIAFVKGWRLTLVLLACIPAIVFAGGIMAIIVSKMSTRGQQAYAEAGTIVEQTVGAIRTVASFTGEKQAIERYNKKLKIAYNSTVQQGLATGIGLGTFLLIVFGTYGLAIWYGSKMIIEKGYNGGQVINVIFAIMTGGMCLGQTSPSLNAFAAGTAAAYKMFETINRTPKIDPYDNSGVVLDDIKGEVELKDVYFRYPARPDVQIFAGFSLYVPSGTTTALVGQSGSGKSTVIGLVERFNDPEAGEVRAYRWENIAYGKENATEEEIRRATELANAEKFIDKLPQGLDTMVGEHGTSLSGGQKQRIAIARAILKNPRILLLDEATSALDAESERIVQDALVSLMSNRTTIVVAHRLTTIRNADAVAVVHTGKIVEIGSHYELTRNPERAYIQLIRLQEGAREKDAEPSDPDNILDMDKPMSRSESLRLSTARSLSKGSSGSRRSFTITSFGVPAPIKCEVQVEEEDEENLAKTKVDPEQRRKVSIKRLAYLNKPELSVLLLGSIAAAGHGVIFPVFGLLLSKAIKMFYEPHNKLQKDSSVWAGVYVGIGLFGFAIIPGQNFFFGIAGGKLIERIRALTFQKVVHQQISWFDDPANSSGAIGARLSSDASTVKALVGDALALIVQNIATIIAGLTIGFTANWRLALIIIAVSPLLIGQGILQTKFLKGFSADAKLMYEDASQVANDAIGSIRTVASFGSEKKVMDAYEKKCEGPMKQGVFFALTISAVGVSQSTGMAPDSNKAKDSAASIFQILDSKPKIDSSSDAGITLPSITGEIDVEHVSFRYPTRLDVQIFRDICLKFPPGKTVALVGESGSGKSTIIGLIERFYDPDTGRILLDGVEIHKFKINWLRQQIGLVGQEPILFNESIRTNIAYGKQGDATEEEIIAATKASNAHNFLSSLPQGYDTSVGERGVQLSGGQKQRIAIARAILKDPKILLLDEATSALDAESERIVQDALDTVMVNRTTIVVAHRLTTIKGADVIAVVKNGVITEKGSHDILMKITDGAYASLVALHASAS